MSLPYFTFASSCSHTGLTIVYVNGILTTRDDTEIDAQKLQKSLGYQIGNESLIVHTGYNESHLAGGGDLIEVASQILGHPVSDYDLTTILLEAHEKVTTRKLLLVGHSQGTFYTNEAWGYLTTHGEPQESVGVYNVATPASRVAGGGSYLTSANDKMINAVRVVASRIGATEPLPANITIPLSPKDATDSFGGHSLSDVYLAHESGRIVSDITVALNTLVATEVPGTYEIGCFAPPARGFSYHSRQIMFAVADPFARGVATGIEISGRSIAATGVGIYAGVGVALDTMHEAMKIMAAFAKGILNGDAGKPNISRNKLSASLLAVRSDDPALALVSSVSVPEPHPEPQQTISAPVVGRATAEKAEEKESEPPPAAQSTPPPSQPAAATPPAATGCGESCQTQQPIMFGVSETPPAPSSATTLPSIQNFQAGFSTSTLLVSFSWSPLGTATTTYKVKDTDTGSVVVETSSSTASFSPTDLTRNYTFSIQQFDGSVATSSLATTTVNVFDAFAAPSTPANVTSSFNSLNLTLTLTWASSTDPDTADNLLSYQFNYSTSSELAANSWVATSSPKVLAVTYPNSYTVGVRAVDNVGKVSSSTTLTWAFPSSFASLPSQTDHSYQLPRGKQKIVISATTTIDAVAMWLGGSTGDYCCSQSYMRIFTASTTPETLVATSAGNTNGEVTLDDTETAHEVLYVFDSAVTLGPGSYWLVPTKGPSATTNYSTMFGSSGDSYADGLWLDTNGNDEGRDGYFRLRLAN